MPSWRPCLEQQTWHRTHLQDTDSSLTSSTLPLSHFSIAHSLSLFILSFMFLHFICIWRYACSLWPFSFFLFFISCFFSPIYLHSPPSLSCVYIRPLSVYSVHNGFDVLHVLAAITTASYKGWLWIKKYQAAFVFEVDFEPDEVVLLFAVWSKDTHWCFWFAGYLFTITLSKMPLNTWHLGAGQLLNAMYHSKGCLQVGSVAVGVQTRSLLTLS